MVTDTDIELNDFLCETCGKAEKLTDEQAYKSGWDYPPFLGEWGTVSPRTCPDCGVETTAWWTIVIEGKTNFDDLPEQHQKTLERIIAETKEKE